jgi:TPR repeat protein
LFFYLYGVKQEDKEAYYWYLISYRNGYTDAEQNVKRIENKLTDQQKQEVQNRVNEWFKTHHKE